MEINTFINDVYYDYLTDVTPTQIFFGGASSGKSYFILAQRTVLDLLNGDRNFLVLMKDDKQNRSTTFNEIVKGIDKMGVRKKFKVMESTMLITCRLNGRQVLFSGLSDSEALKGVTPRKGVITDIIIEEATRITEDDYRLATKRLRGGEEDIVKRMTMLFNPIFRSHWIYRVFFAGKFKDNDWKYRDKNLSILRTIYKHNLTLTRDDIDRIESETSEYHKMVYLEGKWGVLGDVIFSNWTTASLVDIYENFGVYDNGLDFGYSVHPSSFVNCAIRGDEIFIFKNIYGKGIDNEPLAEQILHIIGHGTVWCDCEDAKSIAKLNNLGVNACPVKKGRDSVWYGIQWLQRKRIIIEEELQDVINEFSIYQWKKDKYGDATNQPAHPGSNVPDSVRYAFEHRMIPSIPGVYTMSQYLKERRGG